MPRVGPAFGWTVLSLVFVDELLAMAAFGVWGWQVGTPRRLLVVLLPVAAMVVWWLLASPKAPYGGAVVRPFVKVIVFATASAALWHAGHPVLAWALLVFSVVVNGLALLPGVQDLVHQESGDVVRSAAGRTPRSAG